MKYGCQWFYIYPKTIKILIYLLFWNSPTNERTVKNPGGQTRFRHHVEIFIYHTIKKSHYVVDFMRTKKCVLCFPMQRRHVSTSHNTAIKNDGLMIRKTKTSFSVKYPVGMLSILCVCALAHHFILIVNSACYISHQRQVNGQ